jgi:phosphoribosylglycinamide formyltransferase-1
MKKVIVLTGDELRHQYFRTVFADDSRFSVIASFCEGTERSLEARVFENKDSSLIEQEHVLARKQSEEDFFGETCRDLTDRSSPIKIKKGEINDPKVVQSIMKQNPDLLVCYGSSLVKSELLQRFQGRFLNVHLGLSPYYRGSGTNVWPLINNEPHMVGATFMHIDAGIDTGRIIHQIRAEMLAGDSPHKIGNRLIGKMTGIYADIVFNFDKLTDEVQPISKGLVYKMKDFDANACSKLYRNLETGMIERFLQDRNEATLPYIVQNQALREAACEP